MFLIVEYVLALESKDRVFFELFRVVLGTGTRVPVSIPGTRVPVQYPGTRVLLNTRDKFVKL